MPAKNSKLEFHPLTPERWRDFEALFGERGACGGLKAAKTYADKSVYL